MPPDETGRPYTILMFDGAKMLKHHLDIWYDGAGERLLVFHNVESIYIIGYFEPDILTLPITNNVRLTTTQEQTSNNMKAWQEHNQNRTPTRDDSSSVHGIVL